MANSTVRAFNRRMHRFASEVNGITKSGTNQAALAVVTSVAAKLGGRTITMRGVGSSGAKVGVRYDVKGAANPTALVYMFGPAQLIERNTSAHTILGSGVGRVKRGSTKGQGRGALAKARLGAKQGLYDALFGSGGGGRMDIGGSGDGWKTGPFKHPGTKGKHPYRLGVDAVRGQLPRIYEVGIQGAMRRVFTG